MKGILILLLLPLQVFSQDLAGLWVGVLHNDNTETDLHYEVVISDYDGKFHGFSYTNFIVDGRSFTGVKSLTVNKRFGKFYIEDENLVYNNYDFEAPKGVKQLSILELSDEEDMLSGRFTTSRNKQYGKPVTGRIHMLRKKDLAVSKLLEILKALQMTASLSFLDREVTASSKADKEVKPTAVPVTETRTIASIKAEKEKPETNQPVVAVTTPVDKTTAQTTTATTTTVVKEQPIAVTPPPVRKTPVQAETTSSKPVVKEQPVAVVTSPPVRKTPPQTQTETTKPVIKEQPVAVNTPPVQKNIVQTQPETTKPVVKEQPVAVKEQAVAIPVPNTVNATTVAEKSATAKKVEQDLAKRNLELVQTIHFSSDSLLLELYDNGYVDGDSVSIVLNGKAFISNIRLSEKAERKMIYITPEMGDSVNLVMFAENLGTIGPNSGLAILHDGKTQHKITFSGDLQKNAAIVLRRKKPSAK